MKAWYSDGWAASHTPLLQQHREPQRKVRFSHSQGKESNSKAFRSIQEQSDWTICRADYQVNTHSALFVVTTDSCWHVFSSASGCVVPSFQTRCKLCWFLLKICFLKQNEPEKCPYTVSTHEAHVGNAFILQLLFIFVIRGVRVSLFNTTGSRILQYISLSCCYTKVSVLLDMTNIWGYCGICFTQYFNMSYV